MSYEKITVRELAKRAVINRKTFYYHYDSLDALLEELQHEMAQEFIERTKDMKRPRDIDKVTREFFMCSEELGKLGERLNCDGSSLSRKIQDEVITQTWKSSIPHDKFLRNIVAAFVSQSTLAIYQQWVNDDKQIPVEDIIKIASDLICNGVNNLIK